MQDFLSIQAPEKVIAMYEGVIALMNEGMDIHAMKVETITKKAGIGKGTAYEYFKSKEEIIIHALMYDAKKQMWEMYLLQKEKDSFEDKIRVIFECLCEKFKNHDICHQSIQLWFGSFEADQLIRESILQMQRESKEYKEFINGLLKTGMEQGVISPPSFYHGYTAMVSQLVSYILYLSNPDMHPEIEDGEAMEIALENIMTLLKGGNKSQSKK